MYFNIKQYKIHTSPVQSELATICDSLSGVIWGPHKDNTILWIQTQPRDSLRIHIHYDFAYMWDRARPVLRGSSSIQQRNLLPSRCHARGFERGTRLVSGCRCWNQLCSSKSLQLDMLVRSGWVLITEINTQYEVYEATQTWGIHN